MHTVISGKFTALLVGSAVLLAACSSATPPTQDTAASGPLATPTSPTASNSTTTAPKTSDATSGSGEAKPTGKERDQSTHPARVVSVISREAWGAVAAKPGIREHTPKRLTLHHSGVVVDTNDGPNSIRGHQAWHMAPDQQDNQDIHYHYIVDRAGNIYEGRNTKYRGGTQTEYNPSGHFLVNLEGDMQGSQQPTKAQLTAAADLFAYAAGRWHINSDKLAGHRDYAHTTCPGDNLYSHIADGSLQAQVDKRLQSGGVRLNLMPLRRGEQLVEQIGNS